MHKYPRGAIRDDSEVWPVAQRPASLLHAYLGTTTRFFLFATCSPKHIAMDAFFTIAPPVPVDEPAVDVKFINYDDGTSDNHSGCTIA